MCIGKELTRKTIRSPWWINTPVIFFKQVKHMQTKRKLINKYVISNYTHFRKATTETTTVIGEFCKLYESFDISNKSMSTYKL